MDKSSYSLEGGTPVAERFEGMGKLSGISYNGICLRCKFTLDFILTIPEHQFPLVDVINDDIPDIGIYERSEDFHCRRFLIADRAVMR